MKSFLKILFVILGLQTIAQGDWKYIGPWPTMNDLKDVCFTDPQHGWMVGINGTIVATTDGGETWEMQYEKPSQSFNSVYFIDENEGWVVGWHDVVHTTDGGYTWEAQYLAGYLDVEAVTFINPDTGWIAGSYGLVYRTYDGGDNWSLLYGGGLDDPWLNDIYFSDATHGVVAGGWWLSQPSLGYIAVTDDGGLTWQETTPPNIEEVNGISFISADTGWACGSGHKILKTTDEGHNWIESDSIYGPKSDIFFLNQNEGFMCRSSTVYKSTDGGLNWSTNYVSGSNALHRLGFVDTIGYTVGQFGTMFKSTDMGISWERTGSEPIPEIEKVFFSDTLNGWAKIDNNANLAKTDDGGITWDLVDIGAGYYLSDMHFPDASTGFALSYYDNAFKTTDAGQSWDSISIPYDGTYHTLSFIDGQTGFIGGEDGLFLKTTDGGQNWDDLNLLAYGTFSKIVYTDNQHIWAINNSGSVFYSTNGGNGWSTKTLLGTGQLKDIVMLDDQKGFITRSNGYLYMTEDGGTNWAMIYNFSGSTLSSMYIDFASESEGWLIKGSKIYYTLNGGSSWNLYDIQPLMRTLYFLDNSKGWIYGSYSLMLSYSNPITGIELVNDNRFQVYPNPVSGKLTITVPEFASENAVVNIFDLSGKFLFARKVGVGEQIGEIDVSEMKNGLYILEYRSADRRQTTKFLKQD